MKQNKITVPVSERLRIGKRIATLRKEKGIRQIDLAASIGLTQPALARIENGKLSVGFDILQAIATYLECEVDII